jgi:S-layer homology domain
VFSDVPVGYWARPWIEALFRSGVTAGCGTNFAAFCPDSPVTREQMAVFLLKAKEGPDYVPPACVAPTFADVPCRNPFAPWVEELVRRGITVGCGPFQYCPKDPAIREQMATFLLAAMGGVTLQGCTQRFADVLCSSPFAPWIEELARRGITGGCTATQFCPTDPVRRAEMAVFLVKAFQIP